MAIPANLMQILRDPLDHAELEMRDGALVNTGSQRRYSIVDSIPVLLDPADLGPQNLKTQKMYQWMSRGFDLSDWLGNLLFRGALVRMRRALVQRLALKSGVRCLYTSIGTGLDLRYLAESVPLSQMELVGLDLSMGMLQQCRKKLVGNQQTTLLVQANAEQLPFADQSFDVVFHVGGINLFDRPAEAVREMVRVARPGSLILYCDETSKMVKDLYQKNPLTRTACKDASSQFDPRDWLPAGVIDPVYEEIPNGKMYFLSFRRPD
jgi:ubiquinone/menaquinone biosynthesis C-methylase UbiE